MSNQSCHPFRGVAKASLGWAIAQSRFVFFFFFFTYIFLYKKKNYLINSVKIFFFLQLAHPKFFSASAPGSTPPPHGSAGAHFLNDLTPSLLPFPSLSNPRIHLFPLPLH